MVTEHIFRTAASSYIRILPKLLSVTSRGDSAPLQRAVSDFGFEHSYEQSVQRIEEHYGFTISKSAVAKITNKHAHNILSQQEKRPSANALPQKGAEQVIAQSDGCFIRIVTTKANAKDKRKTRELNFNEARLCAATESGSSNIFYESTLGDVGEVGLLWAQAAKQAGVGIESDIHVVADGAEWIHLQAKRVFGKDATFLVDFYHTCEYLNAASQTCSENPNKWMKTQKRRLKKGKYSKVIKCLEEHSENETVPETLAPVRAAHRYLNNRTEQLSYDKALAKDLPIGSGMIESGHKHVIQARMKIPGAAWQMDNAEAMLQARAFRANGLWEKYWEKAV